MKVKEAVRATIAATLLVACIVNLWLAAAVIGLLCLSRAVQWTLRLGDNQTGD